MGWKTKAFKQTLILALVLTMISAGIIAWLESQAVPGRDYGPVAERFGNVIGFLLLAGSILIWVQASRKKDENG